MPFLQDVKFDNYIVDRIKGLIFDKKNSKILIEINKRKIRCIDKKVLKLLKQKQKIIDVFKLLASRDTLRKS